MIYFLLVDIEGIDQMKQYLQSHFTLKDPSKPMNMYYDNKSVIFIANNSIFYKKDEIHRS